MSKNSKNLPKSRVGSLLSMTSKIALTQGKRLYQNKLSTMVDQAKIITTHAGQLKGAAMKAIQMLSLETEDFLPKEVTQVFEKLQSKAEPIDNETMMTTLKNELGPELYSDFEFISSNPIASASIGQVYQAKIKSGENVIIKIQYPGISESVDSDLDILKKIIKSYLVISGKKIELDPIFEELSKILKLEADYNHEAKAMKKYKENFSSKSGFIIPTLYEKYSSARVITMDYIEGKELSEWIKENPSLYEKQEISKKLIDLYIHEFFYSKLVQTDPNPANFLVDSNLNIVLLDFGASLFYDNIFMKKYQELLRDVFSGDRDNIEAKLIENEFISKNESPQLKQEFVDLILFSSKPFLSDNNLFHFADEDYTNEMRAKVISLTKTAKHTSIPREIIFLHRKLGGVFFLLKKLEARLNLSPYKDIIINHDFFE